MNHTYMAARLIIILLITISGYASAYGNQPENTTNEIIDIVVSCGFENVRASALAETLTVEYENRIYFREKDAISLIVRKIMDATDIQTLRLISKKDDVPLLQVSISREDYLTSTGTPGFLDKLEITRKNIATDYTSASRKHNSSIGKMDIILRPEWDFLLGRFNDPLIHQLAISPEFSIFLGRGVRSSVQARFLLYDDELEYTRDRVALSRLCLDYTYRSPAPIFMNLSGGYFGDERYGLSSEALYFGWGDALGIRASAAWLGNTYYWEDTLYYTKMWKWTAFADLQCRLPFWDVLLTIRSGKFLYEDRGVSSEITRFFRNSCLTIFAAKTDHGSIGGFEMQFLTYPRRHPRPGRVRVRLPTLLNMHYRYKENNVGIPFSPGHDIDYATNSFWLMDLE